MKKSLLYISDSSHNHNSQPDGPDMAYRQAGLRTGYRGGIFYQVTGEAGNAETGYNAMLGFNNNGISLPA